MRTQAKALRRALMMATKKGDKRVRQRELEALFDIVVRGLTAVLKSQEATAAHYTAAIKFLKDNDFQFDRDNPPETVKKLVEQLPDLNEDPDWPGNLPN